MTNFEKFKEDIQTMSGEELVHFIYGTTGFCFCEDQQGFCAQSKGKCSDCFRDWLNKPCKENENTILKPCPFCGNELPFINRIKINFEYRYGVICENCQSMGKHCKTEEQAIKAWNRREEKGEEND